MGEMVLSLWGKFKQWVSVDWSPLTFGLVVGVFGVIALLLLMSFLKENFNKGKAIKWANLVLLILLGAIIAVLSVARFTN